MEKTVTLAVDAEFLRILASIKERRFTKNTSQVLREAVRYYDLFLSQNTLVSVTKEGEDKSKGENQ